MSVRSALSRLVGGVRQQPAKLKGASLDALLAEAIQEIAHATETDDPAELARIGEEFLTEVLPDWSELVQNALSRDARRMHTEHTRLDRRFRKRLYRSWRRPLDLLHEIVVISVEAGEQFSEELDAEEAPPNYVLQALVALHVRACQVAQEVLCLLRGGFAAGAMSRWRTLHELTVVGVFVAEHGQQVAERYLLHASVMSLRDLRRYSQSYERLGFDPVPADEEAALRVNVTALSERFGKPFLTDYGWAAEVLGTKRPTFADLANRVELDHWAPFTGLANHTVHAGSKALIWSLGVPEGDQRITAGASNYGLADPGQNTAHSVAILTTWLLLLQPTVERLVVCRILGQLVSKTGEAFVSVQDEIERRWKYSR